MLSRCYKLLPALALLSLSVVASAQNLVSNGSFETPGFSTPPYYSYLANGSTMITGWTVADDGIGEQPYWTNINGGPISGGQYPIFDGSYAIQLNQGTSITTTFATIAGQQYILSFWSLLNSNHPISELTPLEVDVAGQMTTFSNPTGVRTFVFTATTTNPTALLQFANHSSVGDFKIYALDAVSITVVPESGSLALLMCLVVPGIVCALRSLARSHRFRRAEHVLGRCE